MHPCVGPPDPLTVCIRARKGFHPLRAVHDPTVSLTIESDSGHELPLPIVAQFPATHVVTAPDHARPNSFGHPGFDHEIADFSFDAYQVPGVDTEPRSILGVDPQGIRMRNLIQPFGVGTACMNLHG